MVSLVRFGHFSPDTPSIDIVLEDNQPFRDIGFEEVTDFLKMNDGAYQVKIAINRNNETVIEQELDIVDEVSHTVLLSGLHKDENIKLVVLKDTAV